MKDRVVVITGAARGIGAAAVGVFGAAGARVAALSRGGEGPSAGNDHLMTLRADVARWNEVEAAIAAVLARWGRIDVLVSNAGVIEPISRLEEVDPAAWGAAVDVNLKGPLHGIRAVLPAMKARGGGTIITLSSGAATNPLEGWSAYSASKAGALMLTRALHLEEGANGIRALGLSPGTVATGMQIAIRASGMNPVSRLDPAVHIPPEWPARALLWMSGPGADPWLGGDVSLRDEGVRRAVGLVP